MIVHLNFFLRLCVNGRGLLFFGVTQPNDWWNLLLHVPRVFFFVRIIRIGNFFAYSDGKWFDRWHKFRYETQTTLLPCWIFMFKISKWYSKLDTQLLTIPICSHITCRSIHKPTLYSSVSFTEWLNFTVPLVFKCPFFFAPLFDYLQIISNWGLQWDAGRKTQRRPQLAGIRVINFMQILKQMLST